MGARNLHLLATREALGPLRGQEVALDGSLPGLDWTLRFYDPVVAPALGLISEDAGPAFAEVRRALGVSTVVYHFVAAAGVGADAAPRGARRHRARRRALGGGAGLRDDPHAGCRGREALVDELVGAAARRASPARRRCWRGRSPRATRRWRRWPSRGGEPDPDEVRKALLAAVGGRSSWAPHSSESPFS